MGSTESVSEVAVVAPPTFEAKLAELRGQRVNVGPDGFIRLVDLMGNEDSIIQAARVSYGDGTRAVSDDRTLLRYLLRKRHCYHPNMQVLTAAGWKAWRDCDSVETFLVPDPATRTLRREHLAVEAFDASESMQTFQSGRMSYCVTPDHRMWFKGKYAHEFEIVRAAKMPRWGHFDAQAGYRAAGLDATCEPDPLGQLVGFTLGDGSWSGNGLTFHLRKPRKKVYLRGVLEKLGITATESQSSTYDDATVFYIGADAVRATGILAWMAAGQRACDKRLRDIPTEPAMIAGVFSGLAGSDGHRNESRNDRIEFSSVSPQLLRDFETVAALCGYDCHASGRADRVTAYPAGRTTLEARKQYFGTRHYDGKVYCATTSTGLLMVRGGPSEFGFVCGNTTPFEMCELKFHVRVPMDVWRQWIRHRTACLAGDTELVFNRPCDQKAYRLTVKDVFDRFQATGGAQGDPYFKRGRVQHMQLRCLNEHSSAAQTTNIVDIWESGVKPVFKLTVESGRTIRCSADHRIFTPGGWRTLRDLAVGDLVMTVASRNGVAAAVPNIVNPETEEWRPIVGWDAYYEVSDQGRVRRVIGGKGSRSHGRCKVLTVANDRAVTSLNRPGEQVVILVHREMLRAFVGEPDDPTMEACHTNGNSLDNTLDNLRWGTSAENKADMMNHGRSTYLTGQAQKITEIVSDGTEMTYDLEVVGPWHNFSANDIVVHNSVNEYSTRYSEAIDSRATTKPDEWRLQATTNKQGSDGVVTEWPAGVQPTPHANGRIEIAGAHIPYTMPIQLCGTEDDVTPGDYLTEAETRLHRITDAVYNARLRFGVAREQARKDLPLSTYTEAYWKIDLHNLLHFLGLRMDSHAQLEIREYANAIYDIVKQLYPNVAEAFEDYRLNAVTLTGPELRLLPRVLDWVRQLAMTGVPADRPTSVALPAPTASVTATDLWRLVGSFATICPDDWCRATKLPREVIEFHGKLVKMGLVAA